MKTLILLFTLAILTIGCADDADVCLPEACGDVCETADCQDACLGMATCDAEDCNAAARELCNDLCPTYRPEWGGCRDACVYSIEHCLEGDYTGGL